MDVERVRVDRFTWERLVLSSPLSWATRSLLLALGVYMSQDGSSARPGLDNLAMATRKGRSVLIEHLGTATAAGYLVQVTRGGQRGTTGLASEYAATVPREVFDRAEATLTARPWGRGERVPTSSPPDVGNDSQGPGNRTLDGSQGPDFRTLEESQGPDFRTLDQSQGPDFPAQGPDFPAQGPDFRTPPRSTHHAVPSGDIEGSVTEVDAREAPPTPNPDDWDPRCSRHRRDPNPPPCRPCGERRRALDARQADAERARKVRQSAEHSAQAAADRAAVDACAMCDTDGYVGLVKCRHDPGNAERAARGTAAIRAVLAARREAS